jgi:hypothetical protein
MTDQPKSEAQEYLEWYQKGSKKRGFQIVATPAFRVKENGAFELVIQQSIGKLPEKDKKTQDKS